MTETLQYRPMQMGEENDVCSLVDRVFDEFIAPLYSAEGVQEFRKYVQPKLLQSRSQADHFVLLALAENAIVGMIEVRGNAHISLLYVDSSFQHQGIGRELLRRSLDICLRHRPELREITVNSSPNSVSVYEALGFKARSGEQVVSGIRFTPMALELQNVRR